MKARRERPYWLRAGGVLCVACEQGFVLELGFHCSGCDRPICGECAVPDPATSEVLCRACREAEGGTD